MGSPVYPMQRAWGSGPAVSKGPQAVLRPTGHGPRVGYEVGRACTHASPGWGQQACLPEPPVPGSPTEGVAPQRGRLAAGRKMGPRARPVWMPAAPLPLCLPAAGPKSSTPGPREDTLLPS